jgi:hypothetical protein
MKLTVKGLDYTAKRVKWRGRYRTYVFRRGRLATHVKWSSKPGKWRGSAVRRIMQRMPPKKKPLKVPPTEWHRVSKVWMLYARQQKHSKTPSPLAEIRILVYTKKPDEWTEWVFKQLFSTLKNIRDLDSIRAALYKGELIIRENEPSRVDFRIEGFERRPVDKDEVRWPEDKPRYYVAYFNADGTLKGEYSGWA